MIFINGIVVGILIERKRLEHKIEDLKDEIRYNSSNNRNRG